jgi:hypothetical protein
MPRSIDEIVRDYFAVAKINVKIVKFGPMLREHVYPVVVHTQSTAITRRFNFRCPDLAALGYNNELICERPIWRLRFD